MTTPDEFAQTITQSPGYDYRHAGPCLQRAIDMLVAATWDRETLAHSLQQWFDERYFVPLTTRPPEQSTYSLADHLLRNMNGDTE